MRGPVAKCPCPAGLCASSVRPPCGGGHSGGGFVHGRLGDPRPSSGSERQNVSRPTGGGGRAAGPLAAGASGHPGGVQWDRDRLDAADGRGVSAPHQGRGLGGSRGPQGLVSPVVGTASGRRGTGSPPPTIRGGDWRTVGPEKLKGPPPGSPFSPHHTSRGLRAAPPSGGSCPARCRANSVLKPA